MITYRRREQGSERLKRKGNQHKTEISCGGKSGQAIIYHPGLTKKKKQTNKKKVCATFLQYLLGLAEAPAAAHRQMLKVTFCN